jgi:hypothetical protein
MVSAARDEEREKLERSSSFFFKSNDNTSISG